MFMPRRLQFSEEGFSVIQLILSEWSVRVFLLYLFVVGSVAVIRHQRQVVSVPFVFLPVASICDHLTAQWKWSVPARAPAWDQYHLRDKRSIRIGQRKWSDGKYFGPDKGLSYA